MQRSSAFTKSVLKLDLPPRRASGEVRRRRGFRNPRRSQAALLPLQAHSSLTNSRTCFEGELLRSTGTTVRTNPLRSSPKYQDDKRDLVYYG